MPKLPFFTWFWQLIISLCPPTLIGRDNEKSILEKLLKFSNTEFTITKKYAEELTNKLKAFRKQTKTKKALLLTMLTTYGVLENELKMDILFD